MEGSQMTGINLRVATLKNAKLKNCNLRGATLAGTDLEVSYNSFYMLNGQLIEFWGLLAFSKTKSSCYCEKQSLSYSSFSCIL